MGHGDQGGAFGAVCRMPLRRPLVHPAVVNLRVGRPAVPAHVGHHAVAGMARNDHLVAEKRSDEEQAREEGAGAQERSGVAAGRLTLDGAEAGFHPARQEQAEPQEQKQQVERHAEEGRGSRRRDGEVGGREAFLREGQEEGGGEQSDEQQA